MKKETRSVIREETKASCTREDHRLNQYECVKARFEGCGYKLLSEQYTKNTCRMDCVCPQGHSIKMDWASFRRGVRCGVCAKAVRSETRRQSTANKARLAFEVEGYKLLDEYTDSRTPMAFICPQGHKHKINWANFDSGHRCIYCSKSPPVNQERVQKSFTSEGYTLLDKYVDNAKRLRFLCPEGHKYSVSWRRWEQGGRCAICSGGVVTRKRVKDSFTKEGYRLLSCYKSGREKLDFICPQEHKHSISWHDWNSGRRCGICNTPVVDKTFVREYFLGNNYTPLQEYSGAHKKIPYLCPQGHSSSIAWQDFKRGGRCPYCAGRNPSAEQVRINKIKKGIASSILSQLRRAKAEKLFSSTSFASGVATSVYKKMGDRPEGCHLDHIIPQSFFDFRIKEEVEACWDIENLRWLPAQENSARGARLSVGEIRCFTARQLELFAKASRKPDWLILPKSLDEHLSGNTTLLNIGLTCVKDTVDA